MRPKFIHNFRNIIGKGSIMVMEEDKDSSKLSKLEISILKNLYRNRSTKKIAKALNMEHGTIKEALMNLSSKGYVKCHVGILKDRYKLTEDGLNTLIQKDASTGFLIPHECFFYQFGHSLHLVEELFFGEPVRCVLYI